MPEAKMIKDVKRVRIESDGTTDGTTITNSATGEKLGAVQRVELALDASNGPDLATAKMWVLPEYFNVEVDIANIEFNAAVSVDREGRSVQLRISSGFGLSKSRWVSCRLDELRDKDVFRVLSSDGKVIRDKGGNSEYVVKGIPFKTRGGSWGIQVSKGEIINADG